MAVHKLSAGVSAHSRTATYSMRKLYKKKQESAPAAKAAPAATKSVPVKGAKNGKTREVPVVRQSKFFPAEAAPVPKVSRKNPKTAKLRSSITPGTVLVLLGGRFAGRRVVFLKQLPSGLLLVSGPRKYNGVPLKRVNQSYVIATNTKLDISKVKLNESLTDALFAKEKSAKKGEFFEDGKKAEKKVSEQRKSLQKEVDDQLCPLVKKVPFLSSYMRALFTLQDGQAPHAMKF